VNSLIVDKVTVS